MRLCLFYEFAKNNIAAAPCCSKFQFYGKDTLKDRTCQLFWKFSKGNKNCADHSSFRHPSLVWKEFLHQDIKNSPNIPQVRVIWNLQHSQDNSRKCWIFENWVDQFSVDSRDQQNMIWVSLLKEGSELTLETVCLNRLPKIKKKITFYDNYRFRRYINCALEVCTGQIFLTGPGPGPHGYNLPPARPEIKKKFQPGPGP